MLRLLRSLMLVLISRLQVVALPPALPPLALFKSPNTNATILTNGSLSHQLHDPIPKEPYRLTNLYVHPPLAIFFAGYGDSIPRAAADVCLYLAIDESLNTTTHTPLTPIDVKDLYYTSARLSLSFHTVELSTMTWNEWYNAALMVLRFVDMFDTREFMFTVGALDGGVWVVVGTGSLVSF